MNKDKSSKERWGSDAVIDSLLRASPVQPSATFTSDTMDLIRSRTEVSDELVDKLAAACVVEPSSDFTRSTMRVVRQRNVVVTFLRPALAAAASVAVCFIGIHAFDGNAAKPVTSVASVAEPHAVDTELFTLAMNLDGADPFLDSRASEVIASIGSPME